ncbi:MAG TPA: ABC transporter substrate-binding protein [Rugosimonospora sp.]|nr:ABC transporter substrate-binding protein [Rugosimonospora sp.]
MPGTVLRTVTRTQGNNAALKEGTVAPRRFDLAFEEVPVLVNAFRRMVRGLEFDLCEMALTTYLCARARGTPFTALPVFLVRGFHHGAVVCAADSDVREPKDLEGRTVGVNRGYTVTTGVWARGVLQDEYDVDLDEVTWAPSGDEHVAEYRLPSNVMPPRDSPGLAERIAAGELAAAVGLPPDPPGLLPLIPDAAEAGFAALRRHGHYPINHLMVVRDDLLAAHHDLAGDLFDAFTESKNRYLGQLRRTAITELTPTDLMYRRVMEITGADPLPYGIEPNRAVIEELIGHARRQLILDQTPSVESLFAAGTRDLTG